MSESFLLQGEADGGLAVYILSGSGTPPNFGDAEYLSIGTTHVLKTVVYSRGLIRFNLAALPPAAIATAATLTLASTDGGLLPAPAEFRAYRLTQPSWTRYGVTWNQYDGEHSWLSPGGDYDPAVFDITTVSSAADDLVFSNLAGLVNDALRLRGGELNLIVIGPESGSTNNYMVFGGSSATEAELQPRLLIEYRLRAQSLGSHFTGGMQELTGNLGG